MTDENVPANLPTADAPTPTSEQQRPVLYYYFDGKIEPVQSKFIIVQNALYREREMTYYNMGNKVLVSEEWQKSNNALQGIQLHDTMEPYYLCEKYWIYDTANESRQHAVQQANLHNCLPQTVQDAPAKQRPKSQDMFFGSVPSSDNSVQFGRNKRKMGSLPATTTTTEAPSSPTKTIVKPVEEKPKPFSYYMACQESKSLASLFTKCNLQTFVGFSVEDSTDVIVFDKPQENQVFAILKYATLDKLIEQLTTHKTYDNDFLHAFLLTYRSFISAEELLDKLIHRYNTPPPCPQMDPLIDTYKDKLRIEREHREREEKEKALLKQKQKEEQQRKKMEREKQQQQEETSASEAEIQELHDVEKDDVPPPPPEEDDNSAPAEQVIIDEQYQVEVTEEQFDLFYKMFLSRVRLRICQVLKEWLSSYFYDFRDDPIAKKKLLDFIKTMPETHMATAATSLKNLYDKNSKRKDTFTAQQIKELLDLEKEKQNMNNKKHSFDITQFKLTDGSFTNRHSAASLKALPLYMFRSGDLANMLALVDFAIFEKIRPKEFLNQNWTKSERKQKAPNIYAMIQRSNHVGKWVASEIIFQKELKQRVYVIKKFIKVAEKLEKLGDFNGLLDVLSGMNSNPVHRLKKTWAAMPQDLMAIKQRLETVCSPKKSYVNLRTALKSSSPPCIPTINMYLTDIMFIEDGNSNTKNGLVNFAKRRLLADVIRNIQIYQQESYKMQEIPELRKRLMYPNCFDMDKLYEMSQQLEPKQ